MTLLNLPLCGVRVVDLSRVLAGPWATMCLADMGAEVIKIEHPLKGDGTRTWGVPLSNDRSSYFNSANRNKKSITIDLKVSKDRTTLNSLIETADIVIHNFPYETSKE